MYHLLGGYLSSLRYETTRNSLVTHACVTQKHVGVGAQGNITLTSSIQDEDALFSLSLSPVSEGWFGEAGDPYGLSKDFWKMWQSPYHKTLVSFASCLLWLTNLLPPHLLACKCTPSKAFTQKGFSSLFQGTQAKKGVTAIINLVPLLFVSLLHSYYSHLYIM